MSDKDKKHIDAATKATERLAAAQEKGFDGAKILVIGSPGSGKTYSLQTLVNKEDKS